MVEIIRSANVSVVFIRRGTYTTKPTKVYWWGKYSPAVNNWISPVYSYYEELETWFRVYAL